MTRIRSLVSVAALALAASQPGCGPPEWTMFRNNDVRWGNAFLDNTLSNPTKISGLTAASIRWTFPHTGSHGSFRASPVVYNGRMYIGSSDGHLYAVDASNGPTGGNQLWQFPAAAATPLRRTMSLGCSNPSSDGLASSAVVTTVGGVTAVIFGAPDPSSSAGDGYLFAVRASDGVQLWKSAKVARFTGVNDGAAPPGEYHEQIGHSSPIVFNDDVLVGIADNCDNPIQKGRLVAVKLTDGTLDPAFHYCSAGSCTTEDGEIGGGIWSSPAGFKDKLYVTTGNSNVGGSAPSPDHGLSMLSLNLDGTVAGKVRPVPYALDGDPDFSATPSVMLASCGTVMLATQKDGWTHAMNPDATPVTCRWSFPPPPSGACTFTAADGTIHGDERYLRAGAAWGDVYVAMNGGYNLVSDGPCVSGGYNRLHALNVCPTASNPILRWIVDVPHTGAVTCTNPPPPAPKNETWYYHLGHVTASGGIFYVGTDLGYLIAIADPSIWPAGASRCNNPDFSLPADCLAHGGYFVPTPAVLAQVAMPDGARLVYNEPVLAEGMIFMATEGGHVYALAP